MPEYALDPLVWLSAAALLLMVEFVFIHAIGILLIALATAVMALPVYLGVLEDANQFMFAYGFSVFFCFFFLWKPMRRFYGKQKAEQRCTAGDHAEVVLGPISKSAVAEKCLPCFLRRIPLKSLTKETL